MIKRRHILSASLFLIALFYWLIEGGGITPPTRTPDAPPVPVITDGVLSEEKDGKKTWLLNAKQIQMDVKAGKNLFTDVDGTLYRPDGGTISVTAQNGLYDQTTGEVILTGAVDARYSEGWTLNCHNLHWTPAADLIVASGQVEIVKDGLFISGNRIETDRGLIRVKITGDGKVRKDR